MVDLFNGDEGFANVTRLRDITRPTAVGDKVNVHVIVAKPEPTPDFEAMRLLVAGHANKDKATKKDVDAPKA